MNYKLINKKRIKFRECDFNGKFNFNNLFRWFEDARLDIADKLNLLDGNEFVSFVVIESNCETYQDVYFNEEILLISEMEKPIIARLKFIHKIKSIYTGELIAKGESIVCMVNNNNELIMGLNSEIRDKLNKNWNSGM